MNNNNLGRVAVRTSARKNVSTPLHFDVNATAKIGEVLPYVCREQTPSSTIRMKSRNLIRLLPMVSPTYGRLKLNLRHYFVGLSDLTLNFSALMAEQSVARGKYAFIPRKLPHVEKQFLSLLTLIGSHVTFYRMYNSSNDSSNLSQARLYRPLVGWDVELSALVVDPIQSAELQTWWYSSSFQNLAAGADPNDGELYKQNMPVLWRDLWNGYNGPALNIAKFMYGGRFAGNSSEFWIPVENKAWWTFFNPKFDVAALDHLPAYWNYEPVSLKKGYDCVISMRQKGSAVTNGVANVAVKMSDFGQRLFNIFVGCGSGFDTSDYTTNYTLMPIFAFYKAYWESFGLELYKHWESSEVYRMMHFYDDFNTDDFTSVLRDSIGVLNGSSITNPDINADFVKWFCNFICDLGTAFYTEEQDFTSAHQRTASVTSGYTTTPDTEVNVMGRSNVTPNVTPDEPSALNRQAGVPYVANNTPFSQLDLETLKRLYKVVNRNTIAGQRIAELLKLQGLGSYVDSCKSRFIGETEVPIEIDEVTATSDSYDNVSGEAKTLLGEQGAKGVGFGASKTFKNTAKEYGYYFVLASIVPESGYTNQTSAHMLNIGKLDFYNPEYDGLGMEINTEELTLTGVQPWADVMGEKLGIKSFGFVPRYSRHKVQSNKALGGFALTSLRDSFKQYYIDREIRVGDRYVRNLAGPADGSYENFELQKLAKVERLPIASPNWRFVGRYPWLEHFTRIFAYQGDARRDLPQFFENLESGAWPLMFDFTFRDAPFFIVQNRFVMDMSAGWLKITDAYETKEDGNVGSTDLSIGKA
jgi:hypothetical protein